MKKSDRKVIMNKENRFEWKDYVNRSALYCDDKYIATVDYNAAINRGFALSMTIEHSHFYNHDLKASNLEEAKQKATEIIASEYEKAISQARDKLNEYEGLAGGLAELQLSKAHGRDVCSLDDTIKAAKEQGAAKPGAQKDNTKEASLEETR